MTRNGWHQSFAMFGEGPAFAYYWRFARLPG